MYRDYLELLLCLNDHKVRYLIIGGYAVVQYAEPRYTKDLDIWIEASSTNAKKALKALDAFGAPIDNLTVEDLSKPGLIYVFGIPPVRVDILNKASGCTFTTAWKNKKIFPLGKIKSKPIKANFIGKKDLIKLKKTAGRVQDLADIEKLNS